jgi:hypothetical protein
MKRLLMTCAAVAAGAGLLAAAAFAGPTFDDQGRIVIPENMDRWPTVGATYALQYEGDGGMTLNTVRLDPESYDAYVASGTFPAGAILQLEVRLPVEEVAPAKGGKTQGAIVGRSLHVKDEKGGPGTWTFYGFGPGAKTGNAIPRSQACYACHDEHAGTTDTVFMQFYPALAEARTRAAQASATGQ